MVVLGLRKVTYQTVLWVSATRNTGWRAMDLGQTQWRYLKNKALRAFWQLCSLTDVASARSAVSSFVCWGRAAVARQRFCASWPGWNGRPMAACTWESRMYRTCRFPDATSGSCSNPMLFSQSDRRSMWPMAEKPARRETENPAPGRRTVGTGRAEGDGRQIPAQLSGGQQQRVALARAWLSRRTCFYWMNRSRPGCQVRTMLRCEIRQLQQRLGITTSW